MHNHFQEKAAFVPSFFNVSFYVLSDVPLISAVGWGVGRENIYINYVFLWKIRKNYDDVMELA
jgi:hypothetical protein